MEQNKLTALLKGKNNGAAPAPAAPAAGAGGRPEHAFGPGGAHEGALPAAPVQNRLLTQLRSSGAPTATPAGATSAPGATHPTPPGAINPPEYQSPPAPPAQAAPAAAAPVAAPPAEAPAAAGTKGRGRPSKASLPVTGVAPKIKTLYVNCGPVGVAVEDASSLVMLAKKVLENGALADYRFAEYGQGPGMLVVAAMSELDKLEGLIPAMRVDTTTPEGAIILNDLVARAELVVR